MCLALHILKDARSTKAASEGSVTNRLDTGWSVTTASPWHCSKGVSITRQTQAAKQRSDHPKKSTHEPDQAKAVVIVPVRSYYTYIYIHISSQKFPCPPQNGSPNGKQDQSFVRPSSLIPLLILGDVGLCGPTLTTLAAPRSAVAAVLMALTAT